jgi:hypothetical protein
MSKAETKNDPVKTEIAKATAERDLARNQFGVACAQLGVLADRVVERLRKKAAKGHPLRLVRR